MQSVGPLGGNLKAEASHPGWLRSAVSRLDSAESFLRERLGRRLRSLKMFRYYKTQKQALLLRELAEMLAQHPVRCYIVGGMSYDGLRGELTAVHSDIDLSVLYSDAEVVIALLRDRGFAVSTKSAYASGALRGGQYVDLFYWKDAGDGLIQHITSDTVVRMPAEFQSTTQEVELMGVRFRVPSNEYMLSTLPLSRKPIYRKFILSLPTRVPLDCCTRAELVQVPLEATVHEFRRKTES